MYTITELKNAIKILKSKNITPVDYNDGIFKAFSQAKLYPFYIKVSDIIKRPKIDTSKHRKSLFSC